MNERLPLSPAQTNAIAKAHTYGGLVRWPAGYWSYPGCPFKKGKPAWLCRTETVDVLIERGLLRYSEWRPTRAYRMPIKAEPVINTA